MVWPRTRKNWASPKSCKPAFTLVSGADCSGDLKLLTTPGRRKSPRFDSNTRKYRRLPLHPLHPLPSCTKFYLFLEWEPGFCWNLLRLRIKVSQCDAWDTGTMTSKLLKPHNVCRFSPHSSLSLEACMLQYTTIDHLRLRQFKTGWDFMRLAHVLAKSSTLASSRCLGLAAIWHKPPQALVGFDELLQASISFAASMLL